jgi:hypothetical protein
VASSGVAFGQQPVVQVRDVSNNSVTTPIAVTATLSLNPGGGSLGGTTTTNSSGGSATFTNLSITGPNGTYRLTFTAPGGLTSAASTDIALGGQGTLDGTISGAGYTGGGDVQILQGTGCTTSATTCTVVRTVTLASNATTYTATNVPAGTYEIRFDPPLAFAMGAAEPPTRSATISPNATTTTNFTVQAAHYADDFQQYTNTSQITGGAGFLTGQMPAGTFWAAPDHDLQVATPSRIFLDQASPGGANKAVRYDWPANPFTGGNQANYCAGGPTISLEPRYLPPGNTPIPNMWVRWTSYETPNFEHGSDTCGGGFYKFFRVNFSLGNAQSIVGVYLGNSGTNFSPPFLDTRVLTQIEDGFNPIVSQSFGSFPTWGGGWHTWVLEMTNLGTANTTVKLYMDGQLRASVTGALQAGQTIGTGWAIQFNLGSVINNGPDHAQSRWFREFGVYFTRPSLKPLF